MTDLTNYALTYGQRFLATRLTRKSANATPLQRIYNLCNDFNYDAFSTAVQQLVHRHPALRMKLVKDNNGWSQCFSNEKPTMAFEKVRGLFKLFREVYANLLIADERKKMLDLTKESPVKIMVVKVNKKFIMSLCLDHMAVDEIAYDLVEKELVDLYCQACTKTNSAFAKDNFMDYIDREQLRRDCEKENTLYWYYHLKEAPIQGPPPDKKKKSAIGSCLIYHIHQPKVDELVAFCQTHKSSVSHLVTAFQLKILAAAGDIDDVVIGIPISNRIYKKDEHVIGDLVMPVFVRFQYFKHQPLSELIVKVRDICMESMAHMQYDYAGLMHTLGKDYQQQGQYIRLNVSNNFIVESAPIVMPNNLFIKRLDNRPHGRYLVSIGSFNIDARQNKETLALDIKWDPAKWPLTAIQAKSVLEELIKSATGSCMADEKVFLTPNGVL
jgi:NRPS condensation-like uncharacterized protein